MGVNKEFLRAESSFVDYDERLDTMLRDSVSIYDQVLYYFRAEYFRCRDLDWNEIPVYPKKFDLVNMIRPTDAFVNSKLDINVKKDIAYQVKSNWNGWINSKEDFKKNPQKYTGEPKMPRYKYRTKTYNSISIDKTRFRGNNPRKITLPCSDYEVTIPSNLKKEWITMIKIKSEHNRFKFTFIYDRNRKYMDELSEKKVKSIPYVSKSKALGIDLGVKNLLTCVTFGLDIEDSFIIRGHELKQKINETNDEVARLESLAMKSKNPEITKISKKNDKLVLFKTSKAMSDELFSYNNFNSTYIHNLTSMIRDYCLENGIGKVVIGHNEFWKQNSNIGTDNNRMFCSISHSKIISELEMKLKDVGIELVEVEESYTSKCDHLAGETMEHHEKYLGKRKKRGLFLSSTGRLINADCNGAIGILRKANVIRDAADNSSLLDRGDVVSPRVLNVRGFVPLKQRSVKK